MYKTRRLLAKSIDLCFVILVFYFIQFFVKSFKFLGFSSEYYIAGFIFLSLGFLYLYFGYISSKINYSTIGKKMMHLKVLRINNEVPGQKELFFREPICLNFVLFSIIYLLALMFIPNLVATAQALFFYMFLILGIQFLFFAVSLLINFEFWNKKHKVVHKNNASYLSLDRG